MFCDFSLASAWVFCTVQLDFIVGFFTLGWLAAPLIYVLHPCCRVLRGTPILAGGIGVARVVVGAVLFPCLFWCNCKSVPLTA